ncbi:MAG: thiamine phosphate synthase [Opitutaceae bacterium]|nr:thiamine phosphate synthase [Opitutaceae bacterium]
MRWIVISPEGDHPVELEVLPALVSAGLVRYHVRKPGWDTARLRFFLRQLPEQVLNRCVLHTAHELRDVFPVLGRHWKDEGPGPSHLGAGFTSRSCHHTKELVRSLGRYNAVLYSPVFASVSKAGYGPTGEIDPVPSLLRARNERERSTEVIALGGITPERVPLCAAWGFDGVATLGWVWQAPDPVDAFVQLTASVTVPHGA